MTESHANVLPVRPILADDWVTQLYIDASVLAFLVAVPFIVLGFDMIRRAQVRDQERRHSKVTGPASSEKHKVASAQGNI